MLTDKWRFIETDPIQCVKKFFCLISYIEELYGGSEHIDLCTANVTFHDFYIYFSNKFQNLTRNNYFMKTERYKK